MYMHSRLKEYQDLKYMGAYWLYISFRMNCECVSIYLEVYRAVAYPLSSPKVITLNCCGRESLSQ